MTQEEKARAYDEALEKLKPLYEQAKKDDNPIWSTYEYLIPELAESNDERARKEAISIVQSYMNICDKEGDPCLSGYKVLAYLEKQKELPFVKDVILGYPGLYFYDGERMHFRGSPAMEEKQKQELPLMGGDADTYFDDLRMTTKPLTSREWFNEGMKYAQRLQKEQKLTLFSDPYNPDDYEMVMKGNATGLKWKEQNDKNEECADFTIYHPIKNGEGKYECIPYSFYGSLTSFSEDKDLIDFLRTCFYTEEECNEWIEKQEKQNPILKVLGFKVGDAVRLKDWDGRKHIIKSFEEVEGLHGPNFYHVEFEDDQAIDFICLGEEYPNGYYTQIEKFEEEKKMTLKNGIKIYDKLLKKLVEYVNKGWDMKYRREDVVGIEIDTTFIFVHFNKEDYTKDAYPISIEIIFKN